MKTRNYDWNFQVDIQVVDANAVGFCISCQSPYGGHYALMAVVSPSVCPVPEAKSRVEGRSQLKIGRKEAHGAADCNPHLQDEKSKVKVTRPLNVATENQPYLRNGNFWKSPLGGGGAYCGGRTTGNTAYCPIGSGLRSPGADGVPTPWPIQLL